MSLVRCRMVLVQKVPLQDDASRATRLNFDVAGFQGGSSIFAEGVPFARFEAVVLGSVADGLEAGKEYYFSIAEAQSVDAELQSTAT